MVSCVSCGNTEEAPCSPVGGGYGWLAGWGKLLCRMAPELNLCEELELVKCRSKVFQKDPTACPKAWRGELA